MSQNPTARSRPGSPLGDGRDPLASPQRPLGDGRRTLAALILLATAVGVLAGAGSGVLAARYEASRLGVCNVSDVSNAVLPAVVTVLVSGADGASGSGSGAILTPDGTIVTNHHVIEAALRGGQVSVLLNNGETKPSTLVGTDAATDLAVIKVEASGLPTVALRDAEGPRVGQQVIAMGAPLGLAGTVTTGIVSALDRDIIAGGGDSGMTVLAGNIQTDTAINPGNSGGPLVDCERRVVGVNTAISTVPNADGTASGGSVGIGFAVPAHTVRRITDELIDHGRATHPYFGMSVAEIPPALSAQFGVQSALYVQSVAAGGPAEQAGLKAGDALVTIAGQPATSFTLGRVRARASSGDTVTVEVWRAGERVPLAIVLSERP